MACPSEMPQIFREKNAVWVYSRGAETPPKFTALIAPPPIDPARFYRAPFRLERMRNPVFHSTCIAVVVLTALMGGSFLPMHSGAQQIQNPIQAAKDAYNKAKQQSKQQQQPQQTKPQSGQQSSAQPASGSSGGTQDAAAPWTPPADDGGNGAPVTLDPSKMPDVLGVRLGMPAQEALAVLHKTFPSDIYQGIPVNWWPSTEKPSYGYNVLSREPGNFKNVSLSFTAPPGPQVVWGVMRMTQHLHINKLTMIAALREKYGKETTAYNGGGGPTVVTNDAAIGRMIWLYDEKGSRVPQPPVTAFPRERDVLECFMDEGVKSEPTMPKDADWGHAYSDWCAHHFVAIFVTLGGATDIIDYTVTQMVDVPLAIRTSRTAAAWLQQVAQKQHQEDLEKSKEKKPVL